MPIHQTIIDNPKSERVRRTADLANRRSRERSRRFLIEGPQSVREAMRYMPQVVRDLYVAVGTPDRTVDLTRHGYDGDAGRSTADMPVSGLLSPIVADAVDAGVYVHPCTPEVMERMSHDAQGIVAVGDLDAMRDAAAVAGTPPLAAACWQVRDPGNAGTVIRAADAAGCAAVVFVDDCVDVFNPKLIRATAGSLFHLPILTMGGDAFFAWCRERGLETVAADVYGTPDRPPEPLPDALTAMAWEENVVPRMLLFGNEARGLPQDMLSRADRIISIPIYGKAESLNLGTSAAVMLMSLAMSSRFGRM